MSYRVRLGTSASARVKQLDKVIAQRVLNKIKWLSENFEKLEARTVSRAICWALQIQNR